MDTDIILDKDTVEIIAPLDIKAKVKDIRLDSEDRRGGENSDSPRRALVHNFNDGLTINWDKDYPGGVTIEGHLKSTESAEFETVELPTGRGGIEWPSSLDGENRIWCDGDDIFVEAITGVTVRSPISTGDLSATSMYANSGVMEELQLGGGTPDSEGTPFAGKLRMRDDQGNTTLRVNGKKARLELGQKGGSDGDIFLTDTDGNRSVHLGGTDARLELGKQGGNDGDVFVHDKNGKETIHLGGNDARLEVGHKGGGDDGDVFVHDQDGNQTIHLNGASGKVTARTVDTQSDARCKEDLESIGDASEKLDRLRGVSFRWKEQACGSVEGAPGRNLGLIAQEVEEVLPEVVSKDDEGYYSVAYGQVVPVLVEALKEQRQTIEDQQETITKLRNETEEMQQALNTAKERAERLESLEERLGELEEALQRQPA